MMRNPGLREGCLVVGLIAGAVASGQEPPSSAMFPAQASAITVDVLVLDRQGRPVRDLTRDEFTLLEDGREQTIVAFEKRDMTPEESAPGSAVPAHVAEVATNAAASREPGRVLVLLIDDLGISAVTMGEMLPPLADWIRKQADPRDEITIMTTSGDIWWSDTVARGRHDLLAVLGRVTGKKLLESEQGGGLSAWEAYQIDAVQPGLQPQHEEGEFPEPFTMGIETGLDGSPIRIMGESMLARVVQRWFDVSLCVCVPHDCNVRACTNRVQAAAREVYGRWSLRAQAALATLGNLSRSLAAVTGRKSVLLISEDFLQDNALSKPLREATAALQRGNVSVYFLGARGLVGNPTFSAETSYVPRRQDIVSIGIEQTTLATAGGQALADATGGVAITSSNDLAAGLERMARDASAYYLLGYQPEKAPDGRWHKLEVKVSRPGVQVRARKRYLAQRPEDLARAAEKELAALKEKDKDEKLSKRLLAPALLTGNARGTLPLRLAAYVQETNHEGQARVKLAIEIDNAGVRVDKVTVPWRAALDLTVLVAGLNRAPSVPIDERLKLSLDAKDVGNGWWLVPRDVWLPPGVAQVRVFARDVLSKAEGVVSERLVVPDVDQPYLSTPIITDRALPPETLGAPPRLVATAQRRFGRRRPLFCQYEVMAFGGRTLEGVPQLVASYTLERPDGQIVTSGRPTPIETEKGFHAVRRITLPAKSLDEGAYVLEVRVEDRLAQRTLTASTPFVIEGRPTSSAR